VYKTAFCVDICDSKAGCGCVSVDVLCFWSLGMCICLFVHVYHVCTSL
jgi:hypothetical protein